MESEKHIAFIIPTLCRADHFKRCIESLKRNSFAKEFDLFIALDNPNNKEKYIDGYNKICSYLENTTFAEFGDFRIVKRMENYGPYRNEIDLIDNEIIPNYEMWCRTDDDVVFSDNFLEYMYKCLNHYKDNERVYVVTGYSYPCKYSVSEGATVLLENFHIPMWGTGFWKDKFLYLRKHIEDELDLHNNFRRYLKEGKLKSLIDARKIDLIDAGVSWQTEKLVFKVTDVSVTTFCALNDLYCVYPVITKCCNNGFDGSGATCQVIDRDTQLYGLIGQKVDPNVSFEIIEDKKNDKSNNERINSYDIRPFTDMIKWYFKMTIYMIAGKKIYKKLWMRKNRNLFSSFIEDA